jgi:hypothetical protein
VLESESRCEHRLDSHDRPQSPREGIPHLRGASAAARNRGLDE